MTFYGTCIDFFRCFARRRDQVIRHRGLFWLRLKHNSRGWACLHIVSLTHIARLLSTHTGLRTTWLLFLSHPGMDANGLGAPAWASAAAGTQLCQHGSCTLPDATQLAFLWRGCFRCGGLTNTTHAALHGREAYTHPKHQMFPSFSSHRSLLQTVRLNMCLARKMSIVKYHATISTHRQIFFRCLWHLEVQKSWTDFLINLSMSPHSSHCLLGDTYRAPFCFFIYLFIYCS